MSADDTTRTVLLSVLILLSAVAALPFYEGVYADERDPVFESFDVQFASATPEAPPDVTVQWELVADDEPVDEVRIAVTNERDEPINIYRPGDADVPNPFTVSTVDARNGSADVVVENLTATELAFKIPPGHCARVDAVRVSAYDHENEVRRPPDVLREVSCNTGSEVGKFAVAIDKYDENVTAGKYINVTTKIENTGDIEASQDIRFLVDGNTVDVRENLTLSGNRSETVSFAYETDESDAPAFEIAVESDDGIANRTVEVTRPEPPFFAVSIEDASSKVTASEPIEVVTRVENTGGESGTQNVTLAAFDGDVVDSSPPLDLVPGESANVSLNWSTEDTDAGSGNVTVRSENDTDTADIEIRPSTVESITATLDESNVTEGEQTVIRVEATFTDGSTLNVTDGATFESHNTTVATVAVNGTVLAETYGTTSIEAAFENATEDDVLSVQPLDSKGDNSIEEGSESDDSGSDGDDSGGEDDGSNSESDGSGTESGGGSDTGESDPDSDGEKDVSGSSGSGSEGSENGSNGGSDTDGDASGSGSGSDGSEDDGSERQNGDDSGSEDASDESEPESERSDTESAHVGEDPSGDPASSVVVSPVVGWLLLVPLLRARDWSIDWYSSFES